jgi:hypothetical protein
MKKKQNPTLVINFSNSSCANCGQGASPEQKIHDKCFGYGKQPKGCGVKFKYVTSDYDDKRLLEGIKKSRPDLEFIDPNTFFLRDFK